MNDLAAQRFFSGIHLVVLGAGYIGGGVAARARRAGARVTVLTRNAAKAAALDRLGCETVINSLESSDWHDQIESAHLVLNSVSAGGGGLEGYRKSYLEGAHSILRWGEKASSRATLIYTGSTSVYPQSNGALVSEDDSVEGREDRSRILVDTETLIEQWPGKSRVLRLAGIYGPERHYLLDQLKSGLGEISGSGDHHLNLIHRDDAVSAIIATFQGAIDVPHRVFNVVDDGRARKREIVNWLAERLKIKRPSFNGNAVGRRSAIRPDRIFSNQRIKSELGWKPMHKTFREGYLQILGT